MSETTTKRTRRTRTWAIGLALTLGVGVTAVFGTLRLLDHLQIERWIETLESTGAELDERRRALDGLTERRIVRALPTIADLVNEEDELASSAARSLFEFGPEGHVELVRVAPKATMALKRSVLTWSVELAHLSRELVPLALQLAHDADVTLRSTAVAALGLLGAPGPRVVPVLASALKDGDKFVRACAARSLAKYAPDREVVNLLIEAWKRDDIPESLAVTCVARFGTIAAEELAKANTDQFGRFYSNSALVFELLGPKARTAMDLLRDALDSDVTAARLATLRVLRCMPLDAGPVIPRIRELSKEPGDTLRLECAKTLIALGEEQEARAILEGLGASRRASTRERAADVLGTLPKTDSSVALLRELLDDERAGISAAVALVRLGVADDAAHSILSDELLDDTASRRLEIATAFLESPTKGESIAEHRESAKKVLMDFVTIGWSRDRSAAAVTLLAHGVRDKGVIAAVEASLRDPDSSVRAATLAQLADSPEAAVVMANDILASLGDDDQVVTANAARALAVAQRNDDSAQEALESMARSKAWDVRLLAVEALAAIDRRPMWVVSALEKIAAGDKDPDVRRVATAALK